MSGDVEKVKSLIESGVDVNVRDMKGYTPLLISSELGNDELSKLLINNGADVNVQKKNGRTSLMNASGGEDVEIVNLLLEKGADVNARDNTGETALMTASLHGQTEVVGILIEKGADVNAKTKFGWTSLMAATSEGNETTIKLLLEKGADVNIVNAEGKRAIDLTENDDIKNLLNKNTLPKTGGRRKTYRKNGKLRLKTIRKSHDKEKKWDAVFIKDGKEKIVPFGQKGYSDFTKHKDTKRRERYLNRHS